MGSYIYNTGSTSTTSLQFKRTKNLPIDESSIFNSYEDASKYAKGLRANRDERSLYAGSYVGQVLTIYENGNISQYKIMEDRTLSPLVPIEEFTRNGQPVLPVNRSIDIEVPEYKGGDSIEIGEGNKINVTAINCGEF